MKRTLFTEEHLLFRDTVRHFVEQEIVPFNTEWEHNGEVSRELWRKAGQQGFLGLSVPECYGGSGVDDFRYHAIFTEETIRAGVTSAGAGMSLHNDIVLPYFLTYATDEQKQRWLPGMCSGECVAAIAMTEQNSFSMMCACPERTCWAKRERGSPT